VAVLGAGGWGRNHVRTFHQLGALALVCDPDPERRAEVGKTCAGVDVSADPAEALRRDDIEGVVLATPAPTHAELGLAVVESGKDVLVEKPLALDVASGAYLVQAAQQRGAVLMVGHVLEYHPAVRKLREVLDAGELGPLRWAASNRLGLGRVRSVENVLWSFASHDIALLLGLVGREPEQVTCRGGAYVSAGVEDVTFLGLSFPGGVEAEVSASWLHPFKERRLVLVGERAMAVFDDTAPPERMLTLAPYEVDMPPGAAPAIRASEAVALPIDDASPLSVECRHFLERILDRGTPLTDGPSGLRVLRVLEAGGRSLATGGAPVRMGGDEAGLPDGGVSEIFVHPTATVDDGAVLGAGTRVWHYSHVMPGAVMGERCSLGQNTFVASGVRIGSGVRIQNNVSLYEGVILDDDVFCGPSMVFTNVVNPRAEVERKNEYRQTHVRRGATLGANSTVVCGVTIGEYAFVGAGSVVTSDVPAHALFVGVPARLRGWMCTCGEKLPAEGEPICARCGRRYRQTGSTLAPT
jgi:UDP-2-acetamido-3-amino-2,3-dideoxy-glucuronate N-acetyltransferase